jgi:hypothetical protein
MESGETNNAWASRCVQTWRARSTAWRRLHARTACALIVTSAYRSDAEQAELYKRHPDPKWVAPPGKSLHRWGTELDLGPRTAYGWLARNAGRFHFVQRYSWKTGHFDGARFSREGEARCPGTRAPAMPWEAVPTV